MLLDGEWRAAELTVLDGRVADAVPADAIEAVALDGFLVAPGYVDLQCNGGLGIDLAAEPERLWELGALLPRFGVTAWLPTIVTTPDGVVERALEALAAGPPAGWRGATPLGLHLEGPFLSPPKRGAHPERCSCARRRSTPSRGGSRDAGVALVTIAPDLPGALEVIAALVERGVIVSLGHTPRHRRPGDRGGSMPGPGGSPTCSTPWRRSTTASRGSRAWRSRDERLHVGPHPRRHPRRTRIVVATAQRALGDGSPSSPTPSRRSACPPAPRRWAAPRSRSTTRASGWPTAPSPGSNLAMDQGVRNLVAFTGCRPPPRSTPPRPRPAALLGDDDPRPPRRRRPGRPGRPHRRPARGVHLRGRRARARRPVDAGRRRPAAEPGRMPMTDTPWQGDACSLVDAFRAGERSPVEELEATLAAIEASDLNCFTFVDTERAGQAAKAADVSLPFGGVPTAIKELDPVEGWPLTEASLVFKDRIAPHTSASSRAALRARRRHAGRADDRERVRWPQRQRHQDQRRHPQPVAARPHGRRLVGRFGRGGGRRAGEPRHRRRRRWLDPHPGRLHAGCSA